MLLCRHGCSGLSSPNKSSGPISGATQLQRSPERSAVEHRASTVSSRTLGSSRARPAPATDSRPLNAGASRNVMTQARASTPFLSTFRALCQLSVLRSRSSGVARSAIGDRDSRFFLTGLLTTSRPDIATAIRWFVSPRRSASGTASSAAPYFREGWSFDAGFCFEVAPVCARDQGGSPLRGTSRSGPMSFQPCSAQWATFSSTVWSWLGRWADLSAVGRPFITRTAILRIIVLRIWNFSCRAIRLAPRTSTALRVLASRRSVFALTEA